MGEAYTVSARLLAHYRRNARPLPWRRTRDPYAVLVSEVMLQQTQAERVAPAFERFLARFPTLAALAAAPLGAVLGEWSGLGYNRRARDLHRIARACASAGLPRTVDGLDALPGIGAYTAGAVASFAYRQPAAFADVNIRRVLGRLFLGRHASEREAVALDAEHQPRRNSDRWHHALMDLGATICRARDPRCDACPLRDHCRYAAELPSTRPPEGTHADATPRTTRGPAGAAARLPRGAGGGARRSGSRQREARGTADARGTHARVTPRVRDTTDAPRETRGPAGAAARLPRGAGGGARRSGSRQREARGTADARGTHASPPPRATPTRRITYAESDRRIRGAIVRALVQAGEGRTLRALEHEIGDGRVGPLAEALVAEALIERDGRRYRLPR